MIEVSLLGHYGDDLTVANAARVSFAKRRTEFVAGDAAGSDERLIRFLAREGHWTPFAHPHLSFHVKAPVFVARQLVKHQVGLVWSEVSRRYVDSAPEFFAPDVWRGRAQNAKQGSADEPAEWQPHDAYAALCREAGTLYDHMITWGVAPEQARMVLPLSMMTEWHWTGSLAAWGRVCGLRLDAHAQAETRQVAEGISEMCGRLFPVSWAALSGAVIREG